MSLLLERKVVMARHNHPLGWADSFELRALRRSNLLPTSFVVHRLAKLEEALDIQRHLTRNGSFGGEYDEGLERGGYLIVVGIERLARSVAAFVAHALSYLMRLARRSERSSRSRSLD
jgi:hypothetical protein